READLVLTVGSRLTDFATGSQSLFQNPDVRFASINVNRHDGHRLGATGVTADARRALSALTDAVQSAGAAPDPSWRERVEAAVAEWRPMRAAAVGPDPPWDRGSLAGDGGGGPGAGAGLPPAPLIGLLQGAAQPGGTVGAAAGGPPGDLLEAWDAT